MRGPAILILVVALFLILFFPFYGIQWIGYFSLLVVVVSFAYSRIIDGALQVTRLETELRTYQLQSVEMPIEIANRSILPIPYLVFTDNPGTLYSGEENNRLLGLRRGERRRLTYSIKGMNRGSYRIGPATVRFADPLGLFPVFRIVETEARLVVYPRIYSVDLKVHHGLPAGSITASSKIYEDPTRYRSVREYIPGDEQRKINWKVSARLGQLHSTEWLPTINVPVMIILNLSAADYERRNRYHHTERTIDATASIVHHLAERGQSIGFLSTGVFKGATDRATPYIPVGGGTQRAVSILETLAIIEPNTDEVDSIGMFLDRASVSYGTRVFYLGPPLPPERTVSLVSAIGDRSRLRLYYIDEGVKSWNLLETQSVRLWRITEHGDDLFTLQA